MPHQKLRVRPCQRLDALSLSALEEVLLRAFFVLGTKELHTNTGLLGYLDNKIAISHLLERNHVMLMEELEAYLISRLPKSCYQKIIDNIITYLSKPHFDTKMVSSCTDMEFYKLYGDIEWNFHVRGKSVSSSDMSEIIPYILRCLICSHVTKLDFSDIEKFGKCWIARSRRTLFSWGVIKGVKFEDTVGREIVITKGVEHHWKSLVVNHLNSISSGVLKVSQILSGLTKINVNHLATGELIWSIGCNCSNLEELHMYIHARDRGKYSSLFEHNLILGITSLYSIDTRYFEGIPDLKTPFSGRPLGCRKLKILSLPVVEDEELLAKVAGKILCYLIFLEELNNIVLHKVLDYVTRDDYYNYRNRPPLALTKLELQGFEGQLRMFWKQFDLDKGFFPFARSVILHDSRREDNLKILSNFSKLDSVEIEDKEESEIDFVPCFKTLTNFKSNCRWDEKKLAAFSQRVPSLERFVLHYGSLNKHKKSRENIYFPKLKHLEIVSPTNIDADLFISLVKSSKIITHLYLVHKEHIDDKSKVVLDIMDDKVAATIAPSLKKLQVFHARIYAFSHVEFFPLSEDGLNSFLNNCPDLIEIGYLYHWHLPYERILELQKLAKEQNWNVSLLPHDEV